MDGWRNRPKKSNCFQLFPQEDCVFVRYNVFFRMTRKINVFYNKSEFRQVLANMKNRNVCKWYDETSGMKRAYDKGLLDKKWIEEYYWNGGKGCVRKKRFEGEGYVSPDYVLPDGTVDENLKKLG